MWGKAKLTSNRDVTPTPQPVPIEYDETAECECAHPPRMHWFPFGCGSHACPCAWVPPSRRPKP